MFLTDPPPPPPSLLPPSSPVFDDGDERTLKRSSLCLKGARHYHESEVGPTTLLNPHIPYLSPPSSSSPSSLLLLPPPPPPLPSSSSNLIQIAQSWAICSLVLFLLFSQSLDNTPLTDPENFGTPVMQVCGCVWVCVCGCEGVRGRLQVGYVTNL